VAQFLSPFQGLIVFPLLPRAYALGCNLSPLRGLVHGAHRVGRL